MIILPVGRSAVTRFEEAYRTPLVTSLFGPEVVKPCNMFLGAFVDGKMVGAISINTTLLKEEGMAILGSLYVLPKWRGERAGERLLAKSIFTLANLDIRRVMVTAISGTAFKLIVRVAQKYSLKSKGIVEILFGFRGEEYLKFEDSGNAC